MKTEENPYQRLRQYANSHLPQEIGQEGTKKKPTYLQNTYKKYSLLTIITKCKK
jgi:hypothetical protein